MTKLLHILKTCLPILLLLSSCASAHQASNEKKTPNWAKQRPVTPNYYVGIAVVKKEEVSSNYMQVAKNKALHDLCSEISVQISASSILKQLEIETAFREEFKTEIQTSLIQELEGYEIAGTWNNPKENEYWVYYRLSKSKYELQKRTRLNEAKKRALAFIEQARLSERKLEIYQALHCYAKALDAIKKHLDEDLSVMIPGEDKVNLSVEIYNSIQNIFKNIWLKPSKKELNIEVLTSQKEPIEVKAEWLGGARPKPIAKLPVVAKFETGSDHVLPNAYTNEQGFASLKINALNSNSNLQFLKIALDLNAVIGENHENEKLNRLFFMQETAPKTKLRIRVNWVKTYFNFSEKIFGKASSREILKNYMKKELSSKLFAFTNNKNEAKVILNISTNVSKGEVKEGKNYTVYLVYLDCFVSLIDAKTKMEIYNDAIYQIRGMKPISYDYAVQEAYEQAVDEIKNTIVPKLSQLEL